LVKGYVRGPGRNTRNRSGPYQSTDALLKSIFPAEVKNVDILAVLLLGREDNLVNNAQLSRIKEIGFF